MQIFLYIAAFLLARRLIKAIKYTPLRVKWGSMLNIASWLIWLWYIGTESAFDDLFNMFLGSAFLLAMVQYLKREPDFKPLRSFISNYYPLIALGFLKCFLELAFPKFYHKYDSYFEFSIILGFAWIFARWASSKKQEEELRQISQQNIILDKLVAERTAELTKQKDELQEAVKLLQTTQQQLIQSEKLASLGELTAGIAHEIQNPLNFVNNFSEVSMELFDEMEEELAKGDKEEAMAIASDIKQNLQKIRHHGKRADGIVKGMLQHSRASSDTKEATNLNTLADEYLRLAYHGLRAKDKSFNAELVTNFDGTLPKIDIVPQDVGRVLLNLFNNAFYAVKERQKMGTEAYKPTVEVSTHMAEPPAGAKGKWIEVRVKDNGTGIPDDIKDKILQPFFTTKPTGEGTGLGLSLSYDIIVKGHGGDISIESKENGFTIFIIKLPLQ